MKSLTHPSRRTVLKTLGLLPFLTVLELPVFASEAADPFAPLQPIRWIQIDTSPAGADARDVLLDGGKCRLRGGQVLLDLIAGIVQAMKLGAPAKVSSLGQMLEQDSCRMMESFTSTITFEQGIILVLNHNQVRRDVPAQITVWGKDDQAEVFLAPLPARYGLPESGPARAQREQSAMNLLSAAVQACG